MVEKYSCENCFGVGPGKQTTALRSEIMAPITGSLEVARKLDLCFTPEECKHVV